MLSFRGFQLLLETILSVCEAWKQFWHGHEVAISLCADTDNKVEFKSPTRLKSVLYGNSAFSSSNIEPHVTNVEGVLTVCNYQDFSSPSEYPNTVEGISYESIGNNITVRRTRFRENTCGGEDKRQNILILLFSWYEWLWRPEHGDADLYVWTQ